MENKMSLSRRLNDERRVKAKAKVRENRNRSSLNENAVPSDRDIGKSASVHGAHCSCEMCGNPRKHFKEKTLAEKSEDQTWDNDLADI
jgi:hypothetical protein